MPINIINAAIAETCAKDALPEMHYIYSDKIYDVIMSK